MLLIVCVYYHIFNLKYLNTADVDSNSGGDTDMDVNALDASQHLEGISMEVEGPPVEAVDATAVEACNNINAADITSPTTTNEAVVDKREDLSILTVVQLKDRLRGLNLAVGGRKQELIDRLNSHLYGNGKYTQLYLVFGLNL